MPFLGTLADNLVSGQIIEGYCPLDNPSILADCTILLPTRRAARALGSEFLRSMRQHTGLSSVLLPRIRTLGDLDEEETIPGYFGISSMESTMDLLGLPIVSDPDARQLALAMLTRSWVDAMSPETREIFEKETIVLPSSSADAIRLAGDLARFMDQVETEEIEWSAFDTIVPEELAKWWQLTRKFLSIVMQSWPEYLAQRGEIGPSAYRSRLAELRGHALMKQASTGPVIAAGSTGSIPATARLLRVIGRLENGAVVLPGVDLELPNEVFAQLSGSDAPGSNEIPASHPQYGFARLLPGLGISTANIVTLGKANEELAARNRILQLAMLPASESHRWAERLKQDLDKTAGRAFTNVALVEAESERMEALAIAVAMREVLETPNKTAALVTPDRRLARRVSSELERFAIHIDDSAGGSLMASQPARFCRLTLRAVKQPADPLALASFFKSPFLRLQRPRSEARRLGELLELILVRGAVSLPDPGNLEGEIARIRTSLPRHADRRITALEAADWEELGTFTRQLSNVLGPLVQIMRASSPIGIGPLFAQLHKTILELAQDEKGTSALLEEEGGQETAAFLEAYQLPDMAVFTLHAEEGDAVFDALLEGRRIRAGARSHLRLHIYGQLEARLQSCDLIILGRLNEGTWPPADDSNPFVNRAMRSALGLPLPERQIGLAAHDFVQFSGCQEVLYTRSVRTDDAPSVASRWLQRLSTVLGKKVSGEIRSRGNRFLDIARKLDEPDGYYPISEPMPKPPVSTRPNALSITDIEKWIRDPYSIYARSILKLLPLPDLITEADPALRGTLYHQIFSDFIEAWDSIGPDKRRAKLGVIADQCFATAGIAAEIIASWRPRFDDIADEFLKWEESRRADIAVTHCEVSGEIEIGNTGFILRGRADRIDETIDGRLVVIDYKTGVHPSTKLARSLSPQLSLEGVLAEKGAFRPVGAAPLDKLAYVRLRAGENFKEDDISAKTKDLEPLPPGDLARIAHDRLIELILAYRNPDQGYVSRYAPVAEREINGDYDHLARVREWSIGDDTEDGGETE
jgi:ATP-dependent helicase/nuclease subunit B